MRARHRSRSRRPTRKRGRAGRLLSQRSGIGAAQGLLLSLYRAPFLGPQGLVGGSLGLPASSLSGDSSTFSSGGYRSTLSELLPLSNLPSTTQPSEPTPGLPVAPSDASASPPAPPPTRLPPKFADLYEPPLTE